MFRITSVRFQGVVSKSMLISHWVSYAQSLLNLLETSRARLVTNQLTGVQVFAILVVKESVSILVLHIS